MGKFLFIASFCLMACSCGYDRFGDPGFGPHSTDLNANTDIETLRNTYSGHITVVEQDFIIDGRVTANDWSGNFFRTFVIEDATGAVEIYAGFYDLHNTYSPGRRVVVRTRGCGIGTYEGVLRLGRTVNSHTPHRVEDFAHPAVMGKYVFADDDPRFVSPRLCTARELTAADCGRLIKITDLTVNPRHYGATWATPAQEDILPQQGVIEFIDQRGDAIAVVTSGYADFAGDRVPDRTVSLTGIVVYGRYGASKDRFALKLRDSSDVEQIY